MCVLSCLYRAEFTINVEYNFYRLVVLRAVEDQPRTWNSDWVVIPTSARDSTICRSYSKDCKALHVLLKMNGWIHSPASLQVDCRYGIAV